jgi:hypothetical protein
MSISGSSPCTFTTTSNGSFAELQRRGDAIGAGLKVALGAQDLSAEVADVLLDAVVVGGDVDGVGAARLHGALVDAADQRHAGDRRQRLAGEARGGPPRGNYNHAPHDGRRFYREQREPTAI